MTLLTGTFFIAWNMRITFEAQLGQVRISAALSLLVFNFDVDPGKKVSGVRCQVSGPQPAKNTAGQIEKETFARKFHMRCQWQVCGI